MEFGLGRTSQQGVNGVLAFVFRGFGSGIASCTNGMSGQVNAKN